MVACIHHGLRGAACILRRATPLVCLAVFAHWPEQPECSLRRRPPDKRRFWCQLVSAALLRENRGRVPASTPRICMYTSMCTYNTYAGIEVRTRGYDDRDAAGAFSRPGGAPARGVGVRSVRGLGHHRGRLLSGPRLICRAASFAGAVSRSPAAAGASMPCALPPLPTSRVVLTGTAEHGPRNRCHGIW